MRLMIFVKSLNYFFYHLNLCFILLEFINNDKSIQNFIYPNYFDTFIICYEGVNTNLYLSFMNICDITQQKYLREVHNI